jgi:hypothetical protein
MSYRSFLCRTNMLVVMALALLLPLRVEAASQQTAHRQAQERVFVGQLVQSTLRPIVSVRSHKKNSVTLDNRCAKARSTYAVLSAQGDSGKRMVVYSALGEWCDLPAGMDGQPVLLDVVRQHGRWQIKDAFPLESANDANPVLLPNGDPVVCGLRLWDLRSPLKPYPYPSRLTVGRMYPKERDVLITQGILRKETDGSLFFASAIRLPDLLKTLESSACRLQDADTE